MQTSPFRRLLDYARNHGVGMSRAPKSREMITLPGIECFELLKIDLAGMIRGSFRPVKIKCGLWTRKRFFDRSQSFPSKCWRSNQEGVDQLPQR